MKAKLTIKYITLPLTPKGGGDRSIANCGEPRQGILFAETGAKCGVLFSGSAKCGVVRIMIDHFERKQNAKQREWRLLYDNVD